MVDSNLSSVADKAEEVTMHRKAATLCEKYRVGSCRGPLGHIGFHPASRGGQAPNGKRCLRLLQDMFWEACDLEEGDQGAFGSRGACRSAVQAFNENSFAWEPGAYTLDRWVFSGLCGMWVNAI